MTDLEFTRADIEGLTRKLGGLDLSSQERRLLLAIFAAAAKRAERTGKAGSSARIQEASVSPDPETQPRAQPTLADLQSQLLNAYTPTLEHFGSITGPGPDKVAGPPPPIKPTP